ncbi:MAG: translocation/assembly module TamB domain-containing protein [Acidobacteria bacterium]|nr:translocation/assembly module TamB domain-containing protein [Acidobacteriota bacterium]
MTPFLLRAEVRELRVEGRGYTLTVPEGHVILSPRALTGALVVRLLEAEGPTLLLTPTADRPKEAVEADLAPFEIETVAIRDASVRWKDPQAGELEVEGLTADGAIGSGTLVIDAPRGRWRGEKALEVGPAHARLAVAGDLDVMLESLEARLGGTRVAARGRLARRGAPALDLDLDAHADLDDGGPALGLPQLGGGLEVTARLEGPPDRLRVTLDAHGAAAWETWAIDDLSVNLRAEPGDARAEAYLEGRIIGGRLSAEARLDGQETRGRLTVAGLDLARLPAAMRPPLHVTGAEVEVRWEGPLDGPLQVDLVTRGRGGLEGVSGRVAARARGSVQPGEGTVDLQWSADLHGEASVPTALGLRFDTQGRLRGAWPPEVTGRLSGSVGPPGGPPEGETTLAGSFTMHGSALRAKLDARGLADVTGELEIQGDLIRNLSLVVDDVDLARLLPEASGRARAELRASGPLARPDLSARVSVPGLEWAGVALGRLEVGAEGTTEHADLRAALPGLSIGALGEVWPGEETRLRGQVEARETPLARLAPLGGVREPLEGHLTATLGFDVPLARLAGVEATLDVAELEAVFRERSLRAQPFRAELRQQRLTARDVRVEGPGVSVDVSASAGLSENAPVELQAWLDADLGALPLPDGWSVTGNVDGAVGLTGTRVRPSLEGAVHASDVAVRGPSVPDVAVDDVELYLGDEGLRVPLTTARVGSGRATLEGEVPYAAVWTALRGADVSERARLAVSWDDVALAPLEGGLAGELTLQGGLASLEELEGELRLPARSFTLEGLTVETQPATVSLANGRVATEGLTLRSGPGALVVTGGADLLARTVDVRARGGVALGLLSPLMEEVSVGGSAEVDLSLTGPLAAPVPGGSLTLDDVSLRMRALPQAVTGVSGRVDLEGTIAVVTARGKVGGGPLQLEGEVRAAGVEVGDSWFHLTGRNVALRYPPGLRSRLDVDLTLAGRPGDLALVGDVAVEGGVYDLDTAVREALRAPAPASAASELLRDVALDVTVDLTRPVVVQSSFGRLEATGRITARGDLEEPAPFGRLDVRPGGRIEVQGRELTVTGGAITYSGSWNADLSLNGETVVPNARFNDGSSRDVRVRASLQGSVDQPSLALSSEPALSRQEIVSVIATGRTQSSLVDSSAWLLGGQAATLASGQLTRVARTFGLDEITVRPDLVARETDPSARFTFGKRIGRLLAFVYSAGLGGPETRYAEMRVFPGYNVQLRALRTDAGTHELGFGQRFEFGGGAAAESLQTSSVRIEEVRFEGASLEESLRRSVRLSAGRRVPEWRVQQEAEDLRARLRRRGHLSAEVSARLEEGVAVLRVEPGPIYSWRVVGMDDPPDLTRAFGRALFAADAVDLGSARLRRELEGRGYLRAEIEAATTDEGNRREILFTVRPGPRFDPVVVRFPGARALSTGTLLAAAGGASGLLEKPEAALLGLKDAYRARHFLAVRIGAPQAELQGSAATLTVPIEEGPPARLLWVRPEGTTVPEGELREALSLPTGVPFSSAATTEAVDRARALYFSRGYTDVRIRPELVVEGNDLGLVLRIREGERRAIESVAVSGNTRTSEWLVRRSIDLEEGQPLDPRRLGEAERRLLELGTFTRSAIVPDPRDPGALRVEVEEAANLSASYDVRWDDEDGWSGLVDALAGNLFGLGVGLGGRVRYGADLREFRGSLHLPAALTGGDVTGSVFRTEEDIPVDDLQLQRIQTGFGIQQSIGRPSRLEALVGYRFRRNLTIAPTLPKIPIDVGGLDLSLLRTTQDDLLDPRRGAFWSLNLNVAPSWLGSDAPLLKGYAQTVFTRSFRDDTLTWAQSYRLGLAWGLDGEPVIANERFRAGGASSLRGFGTNEVGPRGFFGEATGGESVVIMNQELRYHHHTGLGLVGFYDVGNVFETVESMSFDFRHTLGAGLRWASPIGLLRLDLGLPLGREPEEKSYRLFFGVGQAF